MRVHESHYTGRAIIIFRYFFQSTQIRVIKNIRVFPSVVCHAHVKGSELTPCNIYTHVAVTGRKRTLFLVGENRVKRYFRRSRASST